MSHFDHRTLINQGRKAGLKTTELYSALTSHPPEANESKGQADSNGFVPTFDEHGQRIFRPGEGQRT